MRTANRMRERQMPLRGDVTRGRPLTCHLHEGFIHCHLAAACMGCWSPCTLQTGFLSPPHVTSYSTTRGWVSARGEGISAAEGRAACTSHWRYVEGHLCDVGRQGTTVEASLYLGIHFLHYSVKALFRKTSIPWKAAVFQVECGSGWV